MNDISISIQIPTVPIDQRTSIAKSINHLISLLLIIQIPRLFKRTRRIRPPRIGPYTILRILNTELKTVEDENAANAQLLELFQLSLNIRSKGKGEAAEGN